MNYLTHWGVDHPVFNSPVATGEIFQSPQQAARLNFVKSFLKYGETLAILSGDHGTGKTTLLKHLHRELNIYPYHAVIRLLAGGSLQAGWLKESLVGNSDPNSDTQVALEDLFADRQKIVLLIDAVDGIDETGVQEIRKIQSVLSLEPRNLSICIALPEWNAYRLMQQPALKQSVAYQLALSPLNEEEILGYLAWRVREGKLDGNVLSVEAMEVVARNSDGTFTSINRLAEVLLMDGARRGLRRISHKDAIATLEQQDFQAQAEVETEDTALESDDKKVVSLESLFYKPKK